MRIEDTDKERSRPEYEQEILAGLQSLGLTWDQFYRQSERAPIYRGYLERAIQTGHAYLSREPKRDESGEEVTVVRLRNPNTVVTFDDEVRGEISFDTTELGDFVIARSLDDALYHFTVVVDDHEMAVTHVIRGEDHISNTPRQILIQEAIGAERPVYAHLPLLLGKDRSKLSKRHGAVQLADYEARGFLVPALVNYLALLGWNPGTDQELFSLEELVAAFDLSGIQKSGAIFDEEKLRWFNREYLRQESDDAWFTLLTDRLPDRVRALPQWSADRVRRLIPIVRERTTLGSEITADGEAGEYDFAFAAPTYELSILAAKGDESPRAVLPRLQHLAELIARLPENTNPENVKSALWGYAEEQGRGAVLWPLRVALSGRERSPDPFSIIAVIGSAEAYKRIQTAVARLVA
jgi:glutamyl-tRNA synthetase